MSSQYIPGTNALDLSTLGSKKSGGATAVQRAGQAPEALRGRNHGKSPAPAAPQANPYGHEIMDVTPAEMVLIEALELELNAHFSAHMTGKTFADDDHRELDRFETLARDKFGAIGFVVRVNWTAFESEGMPGRAYLPTIDFVARTDEEVTDYDEIKHQTAAGLADGRKGYIREDGTWHEDAIRKNIS